MDKEKQLSVAQQQYCLGVPAKPPEREDNMPQYDPKRVEREQLYLKLLKLKLKKIYKLRGTPSKRLVTVKGDFTTVESVSKAQAKLYNKLIKHQDLNGYVDMDHSKGARESTIKALINKELIELIWREHPDGFETAMFKICKNKKLSDDGFGKHGFIKRLFKRGKDAE